MAFDLVILGGENVMHISTSYALLLIGSSKTIFVLKFKYCLLFIFISRNMPKSIHTFVWTIPRAPVQDPFVKRRPFCKGNGTLTSYLRKILMKKCQCKIWYSLYEIQHPFFYFISRNYVKFKEVASKFSTSASNSPVATTRLTLGPWPNY